ncbi:MAG: hypothetical protein KF699_10990 [Phycisphaeraceae bacterium]|nr:hypothetical protein [Phycisphaeraceae bacterium]MBX3407381.1 hypothetical protein [Phycisphaeraceae bacterium]
MGHARRQQPLYEVLSGSSRRPGFPRPVPIRPDAGNRGTTHAEAEPKSAAPATVEPDVPVPAAAPAAELKVLGRDLFKRTHAPTSAKPAAKPANSDTEMADGSLRLPTSTMLIVLAVLIAVVAVTWSVAFRMGAQNEAAKMGEQFPEAPGTPVVSGPQTSENRPPPSPAPVPKPQPPEQKPAPAGPEPGQDQRIPGHNYLYLGTLMERDAAAGTAFLTQNGVPAFYVVDRVRAGGNNRPCRMYAAMGVPSDRYSAMQRERDELVRKVEELGRRWQREHKGASDFRQPQWTLFKG